MSHENMADQSAFLQAACTKSKCIELLALAADYREALPQVLELLRQYYVRKIAGRAFRRVGSGPGAFFNGCPCSCFRNQEKETSGVSASLKLSGSADRDPEQHLLHPYAESSS